jgi:galactokinase
MEFSPLQKLIDETSRQLPIFEDVPAEKMRHIVAPYRICPLGAHVDHQGGPVLGRTINAYSVLAFCPIPRRQVRLQSANYPGVVNFSLDEIGPPLTGDWVRYARGAAWAINRRFQLHNGFAGFIAGSLPGGGLSSSASAGLAYLYALAVANGLSLSPADFIEFDRHLENDYLGLNNGILDQATIFHGSREALIYVDTRRKSVTLVDDPHQAEEVRFLIAYSGISRELTETSYNDHVAECHQAARQLGRLAGRMEAERLSDIPPEVFQAYRHALPPNLQRRATHYFGEVQRVEEGRMTWQNGEMKAFGALMKESCHSSIYQYECGSEPLKKLQEIVSGAPGVYGSRFSGGGYGGCVVGLVEMEAVPEAIEWIGDQYRAAYPQLSEMTRCFIAREEGGLRLA